MCITRVGRVLEVRGNRALVQLVGEDVTKDIDISMVRAPKNSYVEIFADCALGRLTSNEARSRKKLWLEVTGNGSRPKSANSKK
jgi:hydrogenase maturation factor